MGSYTRIPGAGWTGGSFLPSPTLFLIFHTLLLPSPTPCFLSPSLALLLSPTPSLLSPIHSLFSPTSPLFSPTPLLPCSLNPVRPYIRLRDCSRIVGHSIHLHFHEYMPNNGYIIYVDMLQLWIYLLFSYTTCEWSESEFHNKKRFCSVQFSELVHV